MRSEEGNFALKTKSEPKMGTVALKYLHYFTQNSQCIGKTVTVWPFFTFHMKTSDTEKALLKKDKYKEKNTLK